MPWRFSKYRMLYYQEGEMEGETTDKNIFVTEIRNCSDLVSLNSCGFLSPHDFNQ